MTLFTLGLFTSFVYWIVDQCIALAHSILPYWGNMFTLMPQPTILFEGITWALDKISMFNGWVDITLLANLLGWYMIAVMAIRGAKIIFAVLGLIRGSGTTVAS